MLKSIEIPAGDDYCFCVRFTQEGKPAELKETDRFEMVIFDGSEVKETVAAHSAENNLVYFYLSRELTQSLSKSDEYDSCYEFSIRAYWDSAGRTTKPYRKLLKILR